MHFHVLFRAFSPPVLSHSNCLERLKCMTSQQVMLGADVCFVVEPSRDVTPSVCFSRAGVGRESRGAS